MEQRDIELLLKGYRLPDVPDGLDQRILAAAGSRLFLIHMSLALGSAAAWLLDLLGLGFAGWLIALLAGWRTEDQITIVL